MLQNSMALLSRAEKVIPGGVNSPVRAFKSVGGLPRFFKRGSGPYLYDVDDQAYVDYIGAWGPLILGHNHPTVLQAVQDALKQGFCFGAPTQAEVELAELISTLMPSIEMLRMVNSGTEATLSAIRLARGYTQKSKIIKFEGCYHGHSDSLLVQAGSGALTLGVPDSAGVLDELAQQTLVAPYNDLPATAEFFQQYADDIAAIIVEPIAGNMNLKLPDPEFLAGLRTLCDQNQSVLIFDEVMTGFRVALGGAQSIYNITPDLTCLGKIIGGGLPVGAFGGKKEILSLLAPLGPVYQAGTLSGHPIAMTAGLTTLKILSQPDVYTHLSNHTRTLIEKLDQCARKYRFDLSTDSVGAMFGFWFKQDNQNHDLFKNFFHLMLENGIYLAPSPYEVGFISLAHDETTLSKTVDAFEKSFKKLQI